MPEISLIVPVYNCAPYLEQGVRSMLNQTFSDFELILVDDGSTDGSEKLCDRLAKEDSRIRVAHKENGGAGSARNAGMELASGEYLYFPDADDQMEPQMLELMLKTAKACRADVVVCGFVSGYSFQPAEAWKREAPAAGVWETEADVRRFFVSYYPDGMAGYLWNKLYRASCIVEAGVRFADMRRYQDGLFNMQLFGSLRRGAALEDCLYHYKLNDVGEGFAKAPRDKFALLSRLVTEYEAQLSAWGIDGKEPKERIRSFFLRGTVACLESMFSPSWGFDQGQKRAYMEAIAADPLFVRQAAERGGYGKFTDRVLSLLEKRRFWSILLLFWLKLFCKKHCKALFQTLKQRGGAN